MSTRKIRKFAPLDPSASLEPSAPKLEGIIFDVDGTLCEPQNHMFAEMRTVLGIPKTVDILSHIHSLPAADQDAAMSSIQSIERKAMTQQVPQPGLTQLMTHLDSRGVRKAICTRNFDGPVQHLLTNFLPGSTFSPIVTRAFRPPKPDPAGILHIAEAWGLRDAAQVIMVGDSIDDMTAGHRAGAATVLLVNSENEQLSEHEHTDLVVTRLDELINVLEHGFVGRAEDAQEHAGSGAHGVTAGALRFRGGPGKIRGVLKSAGYDPDAMFPEERGHQEEEAHDGSAPGSMGGVKIRGGPDKVRGVMQSAGLDPNAAEGGEGERTDPESSQDGPKVKVRGGPSKIMGVMQSAGLDPHAFEGEQREEHEGGSGPTLKGVRIMGGPGKIKGVMRSAGMDPDAPDGEGRS